MKKADPVPTVATRVEPPARAYRQAARAVQAGLTRTLVLAAARRLLEQAPQTAAFTLEAVAAEAGVARATVFNLFGGKRGLLRALFDEMSGAAGLMDVDAMLTQPDAHQALRDYVMAFAAFHEAGGGVLRQLKAQALQDADLASLIAQRERKRRAGLLWLVQRLQGRRPGAAPTKAQLRLVARLRALLVQEVFDALAKDTGSMTAAGREVADMAKAIVDAAGSARR